MSTEPSDFMASKRERRDISATLDTLSRRLHDLDERIDLVDESVAALASDIADLQQRVEHHHVPGQMVLARVTAKQHEALTYMAAHADLRLPPVAWQENGGFGGSVLPKLVEHGFVDRISGNRYRINASGMDYLAGGAVS